MTKVIDCFGCNEQKPSDKFYVFSVTQSVFQGGRHFVSHMCEDCIQRLSWREKIDEQFKDDHDV